MAEIRHDRIARLVLGRLVLAVALMAVISVGAAVLRLPDRSVSAEVAAGPMTPGERAAAVDAALASTVRVSSFGCDGSVVGSGFAVASELFDRPFIVTNSHVIAGSATATVERVTAAGQVLETRNAVVADASQWDLALLDVAGVPPLPMTSRWPAAGDPVILVGYSGGQELSTIDATVQSVVAGEAYGVEGAVVLIDRVTTVGFSGGPVIDREGTVVGVLRGYDSVTGLSIAVPSANIVELANSTANDSEDRACK